MTTPKLIRSVSKRLQNHITTGDTQQAENVTKLVGQLLLEIVKIILPFLPLSYFFHFQLIGFFFFFSNFFFAMGICQIEGAVIQLLFNVYYQLRSNHAYFGNLHASKPIQQFYS